MSMGKQTKRNEQKVTCRCKRCAACLDDARWERIFQEKFADPSYYGRDAFRTSSPLVDL
jgi:hypothetical protein